MRGSIRKPFNSFSLSSLLPSSSSPSSFLAMLLDPAFGWLEEAASTWEAAVLACAHTWIWPLVLIDLGRRGRLQIASSSSSVISLS